MISGVVASLKKNLAKVIFFLGGDLFLIGALGELFRAERIFQITGVVKELFQVIMVVHFRDLRLGISGNLSRHWQNSFRLKMDLLEKKLS